MIDKLQDNGFGTPWVTVIVKSAEQSYCYPDFNVFSGSPMDSSSIPNYSYGKSGPGHIISLDGDVAYSDRCCYESQAYGVKWVDYAAGAPSNNGVWADPYDE